MPSLRPALHVVSDADLFLKSLVDHVATIECANYFSNHLEANQNGQKNIVSLFQVELLKHLNKTFEGIEWSQEHCPNLAMRDSIDIFGKATDRLVAIELDKHRADQVAKKFVSRMAALPSTVPIYFLSVCYPGTKRMNKDECIKYFGYCKTLSLRMDCHYAGLIIQ